MLDGILILAAGEGSRMAPFSEQVPKPFFCIDGKPLIQHVIDYAKQQFGDLLVVASAQSKHLGWFEGVKGVDSIIVNNTGNNYHPIQFLKGRWVVLCADLLLKMEVDWSAFIKQWIHEKTAAAVFPIPHYKSDKRKGDQVLWIRNDAHRRQIKEGFWRFVPDGNQFLCGISFIDTAHHLVVKGEYPGGFGEFWRLSTKVGVDDGISFFPLSRVGWHTFDTIREIADYEDSKTKNEARFN